MSAAIVRLLSRWSESFAIARRFAPELRPHGRGLASIGLLSVGAILLELVKPWPIGLVFDRALAPRDGAGSSAPFQVLLWGVAAVVAIAAAQAVIGYLRTTGIANVGHLVTRGLRFRIFAHLTKLSPEFHAKHKSGDLLVRLMGDVPMVQTMLVDASVEVVTRALLVLATVGTMLWIDPLLTLAAFCIAPPLVLVVRWVSGHIRVAVRKQRRKEGTLADYMHEAIAATQTIQALGGADHVVRRFARSNRRSARAGLKATRLAARLSAAVEALLGVALASVLLFGGLRVLQGAMLPGELLVFVSYVRSLLKPVRSTSKNAARIAKGTACGERILAILDTENPVVSAPGAPAVDTPVESLVFEDVHFAYADGTRALRGFDARFQRGQLSALVGRSGAGKSTATLLALRMMDPERGEVRLNGRPLVQLDVDSVRTSVALCLQRAVLFGESLRENLLLAAPEASDETLWSALREAGADGFVAALPDGLETPLGANGVGLSGGQQSRLSLARTLLRKAEVLIVDEPFAGLDREAAGHVAATLNGLAQTRVVIVIAHDLEELEAFEHVVFLDQGRTQGEGRHEELLRSHPTYANVVRSSGPSRAAAGEVGALGAVRPRVQADATGGSPAGEAPKAGTLDGRGFDPEPDPVRRPQGSAGLHGGRW